jgi:choline monooxygenase
VDLAVTLIPDAYTSREFFELEREKVFASSWVVVVSLLRCRIPGR